MTGSEVRRLREGLGLDVFAFAKTLGVHGSTLYRWEQTKGPLKIDPLQGEILDKLAQRARDQGPDQKKALGDAIVKGLIVGGALLGLVALLKFLTEDET